MREAPSLIIVKKLLEAGATVKAYDPVAMQEARHHFADRITYAIDEYDCLAGAHCLAILTEWPEFKVPNLPLMRNLLQEPAVFDGRNIYEHTEMLQQGFFYHCMGVTSMQQAPEVPELVSRY
jgi:UDPglucose 6-dehydrogenase